VEQNSGTEARLRGLAVVDDRVAWVSGREGTILRTSDGGDTWTKLTVPGGESLDFRDLHAWDADRAVALAIGPGEASRIMVTKDGGERWHESYRGQASAIFLDAIAFWDERNGLALGDPIDGRFVLLETSDAGMTWRRAEAPGMPSALPGEAAFAASGTCLVVRGESHAWIGTGGSGESRVFRTDDRGRSWRTSVVPIRTGSSSSGIFSLAFHDLEDGIAVGGDFQNPDRAGGNVARTADGGKSWTPARGVELIGYRSCVFTGSYENRLLEILVGPGGSEMREGPSPSWTSLGRGFHSVSAASASSIWGTGEGGRIAKLRLPGGSP
jgi:photosystem II stability/assembly factor-like uncharacterized protein